MLLWPPCTLIAGLVFRVVAKVGKFMLAMLKAIINEEYGLKHIYNKGTNIRLK